MAALALASLPAAARATFPGSTGRVVWTCSDLCIGDPFTPGAEPTVIDVGSRSVLPVWQPKWSPDATQIAFSRHDGPDTAIFAVNADGTGMRRISSPGSDFDGWPTWSADGTQIAFVRTRVIVCGDNCERHDEQIRIADASGGDGQVIYHFEADTFQARTFLNLDWSPDGSKLAFEEEDATGATLSTVTPAGSVARLYRTEYQREGEFITKHLSWSPDGKLLAYAPRGAKAILFFNGEDGSTRGGISPTAGVRTAQVAFTPDGHRLLVGTCDDARPLYGSCENWLIKLPDDELDFSDDEPDEQKLDGPGPSLDNTGFDFQPAKLPVVFVHGYAGSELRCGSRRLWPTFFSKSDLLNLRLDRSGSQNAPDTCGAAPTDILRSVLVKDVYGKALDRLGELVAPAKVFPVVWDWRRDPRDQMDKLDAAINAALADPLSVAQGLDEVVLVGHSFGGLFIRAAIEDPERVKHIRRVLTFGTPYWGAPKAVFPLAAGIETPGFSVLDLLLRNDALKEFAKNLTGNYWLYPSEPFGNWLMVDDSGFLTPSGVARFVRSQGGSMAALSRAVDGHAKLDGFKALKPYGLREYRSLVGTGVPTIRYVAFKTATDEVGVSFDSGDGTVPGISAVQGPLGTRDPLGDNVPISYVCGVEHVPLPGDAKVLETFGDFIRYGSPPKKTRPCTMTATSFEFSSLSTGPASASAARKRKHRRKRRGLPAKALKALTKAIAKPGIEVVPMAGRTIVVTNAAEPRTVKISVRKLFVVVRSFSDTRKGKAKRYGPLSGRLVLGTDVRGRAVLTRNGRSILKR